MIPTELTHNLQASLWSGVVTAFLIRSLDDVRPDYQEQTFLLLYRFFNDLPKPENAFDPAVRYEPPGLPITVNCLWCISLITSICVAVCAMTLKWWLTEYGYGVGPVGSLLRACRRHTRFVAFERLQAHAFIALLPGLLLFSINAFIAGCTLYFWQLNDAVATFYSVIAGVCVTVYLLVFTFPAVANLPLFPHPKFISHQPSSTIGKAAMFIVGASVRFCCCALRYMTGSMLFPFIQILCGSGTLHHWYARSKTTSRRELKHIFLRSAKAPCNDSDDIDTSQKSQEEAILWLSHVPLDPPESRVLVSSLAMISPSRPYGRFRKPVVALANLVLEGLFREEGGQDQTNTAIDCILVLGNAKFQSAVDRNSDRDHNIGEIPVHPSAAWVAQQLTIDAFQAKSNTPHSEGIRARLLAATAWLSPVDGAEDVEWDGWELKIQDRREFIEEIRVMLERHIRSNKSLDNKVLIDLIHGMHAFIPRGNRDRASSAVPFPSFEDHNPPWSKDEAVLGALITYALDLILPPERSTPLVGRKITFDNLASELIDALMANTTRPDIVAFAFWLACHVPHGFRSREKVLTDIAEIWCRTNETIQEDHRERLNLHATNAFIAVAQHCAMANNGLSGLENHTALKFLSAALESRQSLPMTIYTMAMILSLGTLIQATPITSEIKVGSIIDSLFSGLGDPEKDAAEGDVVDTRIYSTLILLKLSPMVELDVEKVKGLIVHMEGVIGDSSVRDSGVAKSSEAGVSVDLDRVRWKAIYLLTLLFKFLPGDEREKHVKGLWTRVRTLLGGGELSLVGDYGLCLGPLGRDVSELGTPAEDQQGQTNTVFERWIDGFPLLPLAGAEFESSSGRKRGRSSFFHSKRWLG